MGYRSKLIREDTPKEYRDKPKYSWSQIGQSVQCSWGYWLGRYLKVENKDNIFSLSGSLAHDILDDYKNNKIQQSEMLGLFKEGFNQITSSGYRFDFDEEKNEQMQNKYYNCVLHYFKHYYNEENVSEEEMEYRYWTNIKNRPFSGFVDIKFKQNKKIHIVDYKTSSMYSKQKQEEARGQLILYGKGLIENGVKIKDIRLFWDFLKYARIEFKVPKIYKIAIQNDEMYDELINLGIIKNKKAKSLSINGYENKDFITERNNIGMRLSATLRKLLKAEFYSPDDIKSIIDKTINSNDLSNIPQHIIDKYEIKMLKAYVEIEFDKAILKEVETELLSSVEMIEENVKMMDSFTEEEKFKVWERAPIQQEESFFCSKLCGVNHKCKYFEEYMAEKEMFINDEYRTNYDDLRGDDGEINLDDMDDLDDIDLDLDLEDIILGVENDNNDKKNENDVIDLDDDILGIDNVDDVDNIEIELDEIELD